MNRQLSRVHRPGGGGLIAPAILISLLMFGWFLSLRGPFRVYGFITLPAGDNIRWRWIRVVTKSQVDAEARRSSRLPRYAPPPELPPIFVVSLPSATERRSSVRRQMDAQGVNFRWWDAVDGTQPMPEEEILWVLSGWRLKRHRRSGPGSHAYRKIACDLSHLRLMHDMLAAGRALQIVLEDDVQFTGNDFLSDINAVLRALPEDWEVLWLNHGHRIQENSNLLAGWVGDGVRRFLDNSGTVGMVYRRSFALKVLNDAQLGNKEIDNLMNDMGQLGRVMAYVADPPLVKVNDAKFASQIDVTDDGN